VFLGVDGGGTKTAFCLVTASGEVSASLETAGAYVSGDLDALVRMLRDGVSAVCRQAGVVPSDVREAFFGIPAYGESRADLPRLDEIPREVLGHDRGSCDNDMVCGWAGSLALADGINVISGTGSMAYGERSGRRARTGGWGELFGDEGSAYWIAVRGLSAFSRMSDGRQPPGPLLQLVRERVDAVVDLDVLDVVLTRWGADRRRVAALCPTVVEAADRGDDCAARIVDDAARELVLLVEVARRRLGFASGEPVPVSFSGGVFGATRLRQAFGRELAARDSGYHLQPPVFPPVLGAALYAAKRAGSPLDPVALQRLRQRPVRAGTATG
jgi:N-acetylglucosamine kinase-like BadF-type ATPase